MKLRLLMGLLLAVLALGLLVDGPTHAATKVASRTAIQGASSVTTGTRPRVPVLVTRLGKPTSGRVSLKINGRFFKTLSLRRGRVVFTLRKQTTTGRLKLLASYHGNGATAPSRARKTLTVKKPFELPKSWTTNCTTFNKHYPHGVGRRGAVDHTSGTPVTNFLHNTRIYTQAIGFNANLDRDHDHIACEKA